jgi:hypothetical protein
VLQVVGPDGSAESERILEKGRCARPILFGYPLDKVGAVAFGQVCAQQLFLEDNFKFDVQKFKCVHFNFLDWF